MAQTKPQTATTDGLPLAQEDKGHMAIRESLPQMSEAEFTEVKTWVEKEEYRRYKTRMIAHIKALARDIGLKARLRPDRRITLPVPVSERMIFF